MDPNGDLMGRLLERFVFVLTGGYANVQQDVWVLFAALGTLELVICGLLWAFAEYGVIEHLIWKVMTISVTGWLITTWPTLMEALSMGFVRAGIVAAGQRAVWTPQDFFQPGNIANFGWQVTAVLFAQVNSRTGFTSVYYLPEILTAGIGGWLIAGCFVALAIQVFIGIVEFYLVSVLALLLFPFTLFRHTAFLGQGVFSLVGAHAVKLMLLAFLTAVVLPIMYTVSLPANPTFAAVGNFVGAALLCAVLGWHAPAIASGLVYGHPALHAGHATNTLTSALATLSATATLAGAGARGLMHAGGRTVQGLSSLASAAQLGAMQYQRTHAGASALRRYATGGTTGMAQYVTRRMTAGFHQAVQTGRIQAQTTLQPPTP